MSAYKLLAGADVRDNHTFLSLNLTCEIIIIFCYNHQKQGEIMKKILLILALFAILLNAKGVYILHGFNCDSNYAWIPSVRQELNDLGYEVKALDLPNASKPELKKWL